MTYHSPRNKEDIPAENITGREQDGLPSQEDIKRAEREHIINESNRAWDEEMKTEFWDKGLNPYAFSIGYVNCALKKNVEIDRLKEVLEECRDYLENRADVEGDSEHLRPNEEMFLLTRIDEVL